MQIISFIRNGFADSTFPDSMDSSDKNYSIHKLILNYCSR